MVGLLPRGRYPLSTGCGYLHPAVRRLRRASLMAASEHLGRLGPYLGSGVVSLVVDMGGLYVFHEVLGIPVGIAAASSFLMAFVVNFLLNQRVTFQAHGGRSGRQLARYSLLVGFNLMVTTLAVTGLTELGVYFMVAKAMTVVFVTIYNYIVLDRWVFARSATGL